jgi:hypothetical protein
MPAREVRRNSKKVLHDEAVRLAEEEDAALSDDRQRARARDLGTGQRLTYGAA